MPGMPGELWTPSPTLSWMAVSSLSGRTASERTRVCLQVLTAFGTSGPELERSRAALARYQLGTSGTPCARRAVAPPHPALAHRQGPGGAAPMRRGGSTGLGTTGSPGRESSSAPAACQNGPRALHQVNAPA